MPSFDVVSEVDLQEVRNAVDQAQRDLDAKYKPHLSRAVYNLGVPFVTLQVILTALAALAVAAHVSWMLDRWQQDVSDVCIDADAAPRDADALPLDAHTPPLDDTP